MKIVYVIESLANQGGTERIILEKARYFAEVFGYDVTIICYSQLSDAPDFYTPSELVKQINLGIQFHIQYKYPYPKRLWVKYQLRKSLTKTLPKIVQEIDPDILIGIGHFRADIVSSIKCRAKKIIESHIPRSSIENIIKKRFFLLDIYKILYDKRYFHIVEKHADLIVLLTDEARNIWTKSKYVEVIPNFSNMRVSRYSDCKAKRVITAGRFSEEKGFDRLIDIWKSVVVRHPDWQLDIFGDGGMKEELAQKIKYEDVKNITLRESSKNISEEYAASSICVITSYFESFSLVLLEAMKHGIPCVAFDCPYGPRSIIESGKNGFLVEDGNNDLYTERLCELIEDEQLRKRISAAAIERVKYFDVDKIMSKWKNIIESLLPEQHK